MHGSHRWMCQTRRTVRIPNECVQQSWAESDGSYAALRTVYFALSFSLSLWVCLALDVIRYYLCIKHKFGYLFVSKTAFQSYRSRSSNSEYTKTEKRDENRTNEATCTTKQSVPRNLWHTATATQVNDDTIFLGMKRAREGDGIPSVQQQYGTNVVYSIPQCDTRAHNMSQANINIHMLESLTSICSADWLTDR